MERVDELNLNVYSAAFRTYDPALGRWWQQDPMQDAMPGLSAYHQTYGNPVNYRDPLGLYGYGGGLNRHIGESAGEQWMREHNMGDGYTNPVFAQGPSYQQQQMNQFFSSLPQGQYQVSSDDDEVFRLGGFVGENYYSRIFYRSFFTSGRNILDAGVDPTYLQAGTNTDALFGVWSIASYSAGIYEQARALSLAKYNLQYLKDLSEIRNFHRGYKTARQATLLNNIASNTKMMKGIKLGARRMAGIGLIFGAADAINKGNSVEAWGWIAADAIMTGVGFTGWGAPIAGIYFAGRFAYGLYEMAESDIPR